MKEDFWNTKDILRYFYRGQEDFHWYRDTKNDVMAMFPESNPKTIFDLLAATSIHSSLKSNVQQFFKAKKQLEQGLPFQGFLPTIISQLELIKEGKDLSGRKIRNFSNAMLGDPKAVVVDIWICRAFNIDITRIYKGRDVSRSPTKKEYDVVENYIQEQAKYMNIEPRQLCSSIWGGIRKEQTGDNNTTRYQDVLRLELTQYSLFDERD